MNGTSDSIAQEVLAGLRSIGYVGSLIEENYSFLDWFSPAREERKLVAAAFGRTPPSYDSALIGVARCNGLRREALVDSLRALAAVFLLEIDDREIREWVVSGTPGAHQLRATYPAGEIRRLIVDRAHEWKPQELLRAKNINDFSWSQQLSLFAGLIPELEEQIQIQLDPLLRDTLSRTKKSYRQSTGRDPGEEALFKLVFGLLTAKVFIDRGVEGFRRLPTDPDALLGAIARHYNEPPVNLLNRQAREVATERIFSSLDFRNLSVEILAQIWGEFLLDPATKKRLGIHRTPRSVVRYLVDKIPFSKVGDDHRIIFEPCSGSSAFLIGAMQRLRSDLFPTPPNRRHAYLKRHIAGMEKDPLGVEVSRLSLTLADFPNSDGWDIRRGDVFDGDEAAALAGYLNRASVVLCNPPFESFESDERQLYDLRDFKKPAELLHRILDSLHPLGVLGFVLPRAFWDSPGYAQVRRRIAERFAAIQITALPDRAFKADAETVLLVASDPVPHDVCHVVTQRVSDTASAWTKFERNHEITWTRSETCSITECADGFPYPEIPKVWKFLEHHGTLGEFATVRRGIEWNLPLTKNHQETGNRSVLVRDTAKENYELGLAPRAEFSVFEQPELRYLSMVPEHQLYKAWQLPWGRPKAIYYKSGRSRGPWKISAFADSVGVVCYQTYTGVWPTSEYYDEVLLSAILNGPVANAFVAIREGKTDVTIENVKKIPMPTFGPSQAERLRDLVRLYRAQAYGADGVSPDAERTLKEIDAAVLDGYRMPPKLERELLEFFRGDYARPTVHPFGEYLPEGAAFYMPLSRSLKPNFSGLTAADLLERARPN